jgi:hypothetical protein
VSAAALAVYAFGWWLHFALLSEPGSGDRWAPRTGDWIADTLQLHARMWSENVALSAGHAYGSAWWTWPFMHRAVAYWSQIGGAVSPSSGIRSCGGARRSASRQFSLRARFVLRAIPETGVAAAALDSAMRLGNLVSPARGDPARAVPLSLPDAARVRGLRGRALARFHGRFTRAGGAAEQPVAVWTLLGAIGLGFALISPFTLVYVTAPRYQDAVFALFPGWS